MVVDTAVVDTISMAVDTAVVGIANTVADMVPTPTIEHTVAAKLLPRITALSQIAMAIQAAATDVSACRF